MEFCGKRLEDMTVEELRNAVVRLSRMLDSERSTASREAENLERFSLAP